MIRFITDDGSIFNTMRDAEAYENSFENQLEEYLDQELNIVLTNIELENIVDFITDILEDPRG